MLHPPAHTLQLLKLHQLFFGLSQLISLIVQHSLHLSEQSEGVCLILTTCGGSEPLPQDVSLRQAAAEQDKRKNPHPCGLWSCDA